MNQIVIKNAQQTFEAKSVYGVEFLSLPFLFEVKLLPTKMRSALGAGDLGDEVELVLDRGGRSKSIKCVIVHENTTSEGCELVLAPKLWLLSMSCHSQSYNNISVPDVIKQLLEQKVMGKSIDFKIKCSKAYPKKTTIVQYNESYLSFFQRLITDAGMCYYFDHQNNGQLVISDDLQPLKRPFSDTSFLDLLAQGKKIDSIEPVGEYTINTKSDAQLLAETHLFDFLQSKNIRQKSEHMELIKTLAQMNRNTDLAAQIAKSTTKQLTFSTTSLVDLCELLSVKSNSVQGNFVVHGVFYQNATKPGTYGVTLFAREQLSHDNMDVPEVSQQPTIIGPMHGRILDGHDIVDDHGHYQVQWLNQEESSTLPRTYTNLSEGSGFDLSLEPKSPVLVDFVEGGYDAPVINAAACESGSLHDTLQTPSVTHKITSSFGSNFEMNDQLGADSLRLSQNVHANLSLDAKGIRRVFENLVEIYFEYLLTMLPATGVSTNVGGATSLLTTGIQTFGAAMACADAILGPYIDIHPGLHYIVTNELSGCGRHCSQSGTDRLARFNRSRYTRNNGTSNSTHRKEIVHTAHRVSGTTVNTGGPSTSHQPPGGAMGRAEPSPMNSGQVKEQPQANGSLNSEPLA